MDNSQKVLQKTKQLKDKVEAFNNLVSKWEDTLVLIDLANEENDESMLPDVVSAAEEIEADIDKMTLETLLSGHYDKNNAIMTFHAGAGGTEAQDWCEMLIRMYQMWAQKNGYTATVLDSLPGDEAGIKSCTIEIDGLNAYGYLKAEKGVHRLVRISPFNSAGKRCGRSAYQQDKFRSPSYTYPDRCRNILSNTAFSTPKQRLRNENA